MEELITSLTQWFLSLGEEYGVNPIIFGAIYVGAIPFFTASVGWLIYNLRRGKQTFLPIIAASLCALSAYIYLFIAGENLPLWVYVAVGALLMYSGYGTYHKVQDKTASSEQDTSIE